MINYRNDLAHFKPEKIKKLDKKDWQENLLWMLEIITSSIADMSILIDLINFNSDPSPINAEHNDT